MTTKHTPATPLPWHKGIKQAEQIVYDVSGWAVANATVYHGEADAHDCRANAAYIAHAANAYPQLVAALRQMIGAHGNIGRWWETEGEHRFQNQIDNLNLPRPTAEVIRQQVTDETAALLRSLGEAE